MRVDNHAVFLATRADLDACAQLYPNDCMASRNWFTLDDAFCSPLRLWNRPPRRALKPCGEEKKGVELGGEGRRWM